MAFLPSYPPAIASSLPSETVIVHEQFPDEMLLLQLTQKKYAEESFLFHVVLNDFLLSVREKMDLYYSVHTTDVPHDPRTTKRLWLLASMQFLRFVAVTGDVFLEDWWVFFAASYLIAHKITSPTASSTLSLSDVLNLVGMYPKGRHDKIEAAEAILFQAYFRFPPALETVPELHLRVCLGKLHIASKQNIKVEMVWRTLHDELSRTTLFIRFDHRTTCECLLRMSMECVWSSRPMLSEIKFTEEMLPRTNAEPFHVYDMIFVPTFLAHLKENRHKLFNLVARSLDRCRSLRQDDGPDRSAIYGNVIEVPERRRSWVPQPVSMRTRCHGWRLWNEFTRSASGKSLPHPPNRTKRDRE